MQILTRRRPRPKTVPFSVFAVLMALILFSGLIHPAPVRSQQSDNAGNGIVSIEGMQTSLENALSGQTVDLADLKVQLQRLEILRKVIHTEINAYNSQNAAHGQLLLVPRLRIEDLENALKNNRQALRALGERVESFQGRWDATSIQLQRVSDRIELARTQVANIRQAQLPGNRQQKLETTTRKLLEVLQEIKQLGTQYLTISGELLDQLKKVQAEKAAFGEKLATQLATQQKGSLFIRTNPFQRLSGQALAEELRHCGVRIQALFNVAEWEKLWAQAKLAGFVHWAFFLAVLPVMLTLQRWSNVRLRRIEKQYGDQERYYSRLGAFLMHRSEPYLGLALLFGLYSSASFSLFTISFAKFLFFIFLILLVTRWGLGYLEHGFQGPPTEVRTFVSGHLKRFFHVFRTTSLISIIVIWISGIQSLLYWVALTLLTTVYFTWVWVFWRQMRLVAAEGVREGQAAPSPKWLALLRRWLYLVFGAGLLLSLTGYNALTAFWIRAWFETVALLFWAWISLNAIREWRREHLAKKAAADEDHPLTLIHQWRWSLIQISRAAWFLILGTGLVWVWDSNGVLWGHLGWLFDYSLTVGSLNFSIESIVESVIILFITNAAVRIGRTLLDEKILHQRSFEPGLRDSILTITGYLGWGFGLLLVLAVIGVNATSLAVVFGALSVGIGFGLQNIFNNFISGLILLFERPIQVGDYVEIGGLWAEVKKINVRATVVQTFDNASVIIPNSEFISQRVTNWSFKDKRMRRIIDVGVAYGSDIDLVQQTLLNIAQKRKRVLKYPKPDVIFVDHADSALIFRLRIWVHVDDYWEVPSKIRFDLDKRFRELGIEIAFPQRDLHVRTLPNEIASRIPASSSEEANASDLGKVET